MFVESGLQRPSQGHRGHDGHQPQPPVHFPGAKRGSPALTLTVFSERTEGERLLTLSRRVGETGV